MKYWHYRAFDEDLRMQEGILVGPLADDEKSHQMILLQLRQQGLQGVELRPATAEEYNRQEQLNKLKARLTAPNKTPHSIRRHQSTLWSSITG